MCGISGYVSNNKIINSRSENVLFHRGPDAYGEYQANISQKNIYLKHSRLSIIDLTEAGRQPMVTNDGNYIIVYNGEIYNYEVLKDKYLKGYSFKSRTDTEVILNLYQKLGVGFVKELNGDFAIAIVDKAKSKIYLLRDHFGVKPLYYYAKNGNLIFGSEIKAILSYGIQAKLDLEKIENYFVFKYCPGNKTIFENILRVPPAHFLEMDIKSGIYTLTKYWEIVKKPLSSKYADRKEELYNLVKNAVEIRLMSDVPIGTFFSGGIDSSIIAWFLKDIPQITHYTARKTVKDLKKEGTTSDFHFAEYLSAKWNLNMIPVDISTSELNSSLIEKTLWYGDDLIADGSQIPSYLIANEARKKSTVMLSGMGADELFFGYKGHLLAFLSEKSLRLPSALVNPVVKYMTSLNPGRGFFKSYKRHLKQFGRYYSAFGKSRYGLFSIVGDYNNAVSLLNNPSDSSIHIFDNYFNNDEDIFDNLFRFEQENFLVKNLHYVDRMCMANSIEGRVPFLDYRIAEFAYSLPLNDKISLLGTSKKILKDSFTHVLPGSLVRRRKAGFGMPLRSIFSSEQKIFELLNLEFFGSFDYFNTDNIKRIIKNHTNGNEDNSALIYSLICFQFWHRIWIEGKFHHLIINK
jgi:asparagine synthase (glutamine-hydrolysing)